MKLKIKTELLKELVNKAIKAASNNKMIPITGLLALQVENHMLSLTTTDATNTLRVIEKNVDSDDMYVVVSAELFGRLISKITTENITLEISNDSLIVHGNGVYTLEIPTNEDGTGVRFPNLKDIDTDEKTTVALDDIKSILLSNRQALASTLEIPSLTGYHIADKVITTDTFKVCANAIKLLDTPALLSPEMVELLNILENPTVNIFRKDGLIRFETPSIIIQGAELDGIEDFPIYAIDGFLSRTFNHMCRVNKADLMSILDRLQLFITPYDKNGLYLTFTTDSVQFTSKRSNGTEMLTYLAAENADLFACCVDVELLRSQILGIGTDTVEIWYGDSKAIKLNSGKITQIIALLEDERETDV